MMLWEGRTVCNRMSLWDGGTLFLWVSDTECAVMSLMPYNVNKVGTLIMMSVEKKWYGDTAYIQ